MEYVEQKIKIIKSKFNSNEISAFLTVLILGFISHAFTFFNHVFYGDGIKYINSLGSSLQSGRWGLELIYMLRNYFFKNNTIPFINGILTISLIGLIVIFILKTLEIKNKILSIILAGLMVSFPVVASLFIYMFTAPAYFLAILLNVIAIYLFSKNKSLLAFIISILLITFALGIYQAFLGISVGLSILVLIKDIVNSEKTVRNIVIDGFKYLLILIISLALYFTIHKISIELSNVTMSAHNGLNNIGKIEILKIPNQIIKAYKEFFLFSWFNIHGNVIVRILIISSFLLSMILTIKTFLISKIEFSKKILFALALILFPLSINVIYLFSTDEKYLVQIQSCYSLSFLFVYIIYMLENTEKIEFKAKNLIYATNIISLILLIFSYIYIDNASYFNLYSENRKVEAIYSNLYARIQSLPGYKTNMKILYLGEGDIDMSISNVGNQLILPHKYSYYKAENILNIHSRRKQMAFYTGFDQEVFDDRYGTLTNSREVKEMETYPNDGSIKIIDNVIVVKFN